MKFIKYAIWKYSVCMFSFDGDSIKSDKKFWFFS